MGRAVAGGIGGRKKTNEGIDDDGKADAQVLRSDFLNTLLDFAFHLVTTHTHIDGLH